MKAHEMREGSEAFDRFRKAVATIVSVPKAKVVRLEAQLKKKRRARQK